MEQHIKLSQASLIDICYFITWKTQLYIKNTDGGKEKYTLEIRYVFGVLNPKSIKILQDIPIKHDFYKYFELINKTL